MDREPNNTTKYTNCVAFIIDYAMQLLCIYPQITPSLIKLINKKSCARHNDPPIYIHSVCHTIYVILFGKNDLFLTCHCSISQKCFHFWTHTINSKCSCCYKQQPRRVTHLRAWPLPRLVGDPFAVCIFWYVGRILPLYASTYRHCMRATTQSWKISSVDMFTGGQSVILCFCWVDMACAMQHQV